MFIAIFLWEVKIGVHMPVVTVTATRVEGTKRLFFCVLSVLKFGRGRISVKKKKKKSESGSKPCESISSRVFNMTLVSNVKKQLERIDSTPPDYWHKG